MEDETVASEEMGCGQNLVLLFNLRDGVLVDGLHVQQHKESSKTVKKSERGLSQKYWEILFLCFLIEVVKGMCEANHVNLFTYLGQSVCWATQVPSNITKFTSGHNMAKDKKQK